MATHHEGTPRRADVVPDDLEAGERFSGELLGRTFRNGSKGHGHYARVFHDGKNVAALAPEPDGRMPTGARATPFGRFAVINDSQGASFAVIDLATTEGRMPL